MNDYHTNYLQDGTLESKLTGLPDLNQAPLCVYEQKRLVLLKSALHYSCGNTPVLVYEPEMEAVASEYRKSDEQVVLLSKDVLKKRFNDAIIDYVLETERVAGTTKGDYISGPRASKLIFSFLKFGPSYSRSENVWDEYISKQRLEDHSEKYKNSSSK